MKYKFLSLLVALMLLGIQASYGVTETSFNSSSSGTTSATAFVPAGGGLANITDLTYKLDSGVTTGTVGEYIGKQQYSVSSSTASSASVIWFANTNTAVGVSSYIIYQDVNGNYYLRKVTVATTTSVTLASSIAITTATSEKLWSCLSVVERAVSNNTSVTTGPKCDIWFPKDVPAALVIDGNTTACRISISGARGARQ